MSASFKESNLMTGRKAGADLTAKLHFAVDLDAAGDIVLAGAGAGIGILMNAPQIGDPAEVAWVGGGSLGQAAGALAINIDVASDANGRLVAAVIGDIILGKTISAVAALDEKVELLNLHYEHP